MPTTKDPMTKEIEENETQKVEMMQLIIEKATKSRKWRMRWRKW